MRRKEKIKVEEVIINNLETGACCLTPDNYAERETIRQDT